MAYDMNVFSLDGEMSVHIVSMTIEFRTVLDYLRDNFAKEKNILINKCFEWTQ